MHAIIQYASKPEASINKENIKKIRSLKNYGLSNRPKSLEGNGVISHISRGTLNLEPPFDHKIMIFQEAKNDYLCTAPISFPTYLLKV